MVDRPVYNEIRIKKFGYFFTPGKVFEGGILNQVAIIMEIGIIIVF